MEVKGGDVAQVAIRVAFFFLSSATLVFFLLFLQ